MRFLYRVKQVLFEKELFFMVAIFGLASMLADLCSDIDKNKYAAIIRSLGLGLFLGISLISLMVNKYRNQIIVPIMFTEVTDKRTSRSMFDSFIRSNKKLTRQPLFLQNISGIKESDLLMRLDNNPRDSIVMNDWIEAWNELVREWENSIDQELTNNVLCGDGYCYHIYPHVTVPLSFALGATVNLRRPLILYHHQNDKYYSVFNLTNPRDIAYEPEEAIMPPVTIPENVDELEKGKKLILHIVISSSHPVKFEGHDEYQSASNAAILYACDLRPEVDWLPYVQNIVRIAKPIINQYEQVDVCLNCPSVIAFALGMALSRNGSIVVCDHRNGKYNPVFPLSEIEKKLHFS